MEKLNEFKVGDVKVDKGIKTTVTDIDPRTGAVSWDVEYAADYLKLYQQIQTLFNEVNKASSQSTADPFVKEWGKEVRNLRNSLRTYLRNNKAEEYSRVRGVSEEMTTGGTASFTSNVGTGDQYLTKYAFNPNKKAKGTTSNYYYKLGYKPVNQKELNKQAKGIEVKQLWGK
tara:strand:- start:754 stop:1269 length:516 start_codon:yes stop_codon:yes gene_type:complete